VRECDSVNEHLISRGLVVPFRDMGYYGGFVDDEPWEPWDRATEEFNICEDCVRTMLRALPGLARKVAARYPDETFLQVL
jgi:hypothetical protein